MTERRAILEAVGRVASRVMERRTSLLYTAAHHRTEMQEGPRICRQIRLFVTLLPPSGRLRDDVPVQLSTI